jgi:hypothetical protein
MRGARDTPLPPSKQPEGEQMQAQATSPGSAIGQAEPFRQVKAKGSWQLISTVEANLNDVAKKILTRTRTDWSKGHPMNACQNESPDA